MAAKETVAEPPVATSAAPAVQRSIFARIKIAAFVGSVILVECLIAYLLIPSAGDIKAIAEARQAAQNAPPFPLPLDDDGRRESAIPTTEVDLGAFSVAAYQPTSNTTMRIDFHLFGIVQKQDERQFLELKAKNEHRFRDQVLITVRSSEVTDLTDAGLGLLKRKILEKTNHVLGKPLLQSVIFSDFSFVEQ